jgi:hypothetical protein
MNTVETMRLFCDGAMSIHDIYALLMSMGHSHQDCVNAFGVLQAEPGSYLRVGAYHKEELQAELYLTARKNV